jgi:stage III sporulation protein AH
MDIKEIGKKVKEYDYKKLLNTKAFLIVGCITLIGIAILVSTLVNSQPQETANNESTKILGNTVLVDNNVSDAQETVNQGTNENDFFAASAMSRQNVRDEALEVLQQIADNPEALPDAKEKALADIAAIAENITVEGNIETLIKSKGFENCVAIISGEKCNVIVKSKGLLPGELAQILDIVYQQSNILPANVTVIEK